MPYILKDVDDGVMVCKKQNPNKCFSKKPLPRETAKKQLIAIIISERSRSSAKPKANAKPKAKK